MAVLDKRQGITARESRTKALAFPTILRAKTDTIDEAVGVGTEVGTAVGLAFLELAQQLQLHIAHLKEFVRGPMTVVAHTYTYIIGKVAASGEKF